MAGSALSSSSRAYTGILCPLLGTCFHATIWDIAIYVGTIGLFIVLFFLFIRGLPMISIHEIRNLLVSGDHK